MKVACTVRSGGKQRKPHSRQRPCGTNNIRHREMLDDIYILQDYVNIVNNKMLNTVASRVIRRIVTYHYMVQTEVKTIQFTSITKNKRKEEGDKGRFCGWLLRTKYYIKKGYDSIAVSSI